MAGPVLMPAAAARCLPLFGGEIFLTMPLALTGAGVSLFEDVRAPGDGPPLHVHHGEDELFRIVAGHFRLKVGDEILEAGPGDTAFLPRDVPHSFINCGDGIGRVVCICQPGGFERFFQEVMDEGLAVPADMDRIALLAARYRLEFLGPNPFMAA